MTQVHGTFLSLPFLFSLVFLFYLFVYFWGCGISRAALIWGRTSVFPGCAAHTGWHPRHATCIWPRSSVWTPTGLQSQPPPLKPSLAQKTAPPIKSCSTPSTPHSPSQYLISLFHTGDMHKTHVHWTHIQPIQIKLSQDNCFSSPFPQTCILVVVPETWLQKP